MTSINRCVPRKRKKNDDDDTFANEKYPNTEISPGLKIQLFLLLFFFFSNKKNAVNWTVEPGQDPLNLARIGYIDIKRYFRAIYLHK